MDKRNAVSLRVLPVAKHVSELGHSSLIGVLLKQQVEALGSLEAALKDGAVLQAFWVTTPSIKDVMIIPRHCLHGTCDVSTHARVSQASHKITPGVLNQSTKNV